MGVGLFDLDEELVLVRVVLRCDVDAIGVGDDGGVVEGPVVVVGLPRVVVGDADAECGAQEVEPSLEVVDDLLPPATWDVVLDERADESELEEPFADSAEEDAPKGVASLGGETNQERAAVVATP